MVLQAHPLILWDLRRVLQVLPGRREKASELALSPDDLLEANLERSEVLPEEVIDAPAEPGVVLHRVSLMGTPLQPLEQLRLDVG